MLGHNSTYMVEKTYGHITKRMRQQSSATLIQVFQKIRNEKSTPQAPDRYPHQ